jgi:hypothetical protein
MRMDPTAARSAEEVSRSSSSSSSSSSSHMFWCYMCTLRPSTCKQCHAIWLGPLNAQDCACSSVVIVTC